MSVEAPHKHNQKTRVCVCVACFNVSFSVGTKYSVNDKKTEPLTLCVCVLVLLPMCLLLFLDMLWLSLQPFERPLARVRLIS